MLIPLPKETIDKIFECHDTPYTETPHQTDVIIDIYKVVYPCWDEIEKIDGWPTISKGTNEYLFKKFIAFDCKHHPRVIAGGLWLNNGFSSLEPGDIPDFMVDRDQTPIIRKGVCIGCGKREITWQTETIAICAFCGNIVEVTI